VHDDRHQVPTIHRRKPLARLDSLLIEAWCAIDGDRFDEDGTNNETVMRFLSMARDELKALKSGLRFDALNTDVATKRRPPSRSTGKAPVESRGFSLPRRW